MRGFTAQNTLPPGSHRASTGAFRTWGQWTGDRSSLPYIGLVDRRPVVCPNLAMGFWVPLQAPVHRCGRWVCCVASVVSRATWLLFTGAPARCVALRVRCPGPLGSCSLVCPLGVLCCVCGVLGHLAPVHRCVRAVCCVVSAVFWATSLLFTGVSARCVGMRVWRPRPLGPSAHRCARSVCCVACAVSWASWLLFTGALARCVALRARCPGPLRSCSPVCQAVVSRPFVALVARECAVSWPSWCPFNGVRAVCGARVPLVVVSLFLPR